MAAPAGGDGNPVKDLIFFIGLIFGLMFLWYYMGGRERRDQNENPFLQDPTGTTVTTKSNSTYQNKISVSAPYDGRNSNPSKEYIIVEAPSSNEAKINITGWKIQNKKGEISAIGQASDLPIPDQKNEISNVYLSPGEKIYISTGFSPVGVSFRVNKCSGYFNQRVPFYPKLEEVCPNPANADTYPSYIENSCIDYMKKNTEKCKTISTLSDLSAQCISYLSAKISYQGCTDDYKGDSDFYKKEWRLFLNKSSEMWSDETDTIILKDSKGKTVNTTTI